MSIKSFALYANLFVWGVFILCLLVADNFNTALAFACWVILFAFSWVLDRLCTFGDHKREE